MPVYSGNFETYMINQLQEIDMLNGLLSKDHSYRAVNISKSQLYEQMKHLQEIVERQYS